MLELSQKPEHKLRQQGQNKKILIVDDEAVIRDLCMRALKGYDVVQAADGDAAIALFEKGGIDVVLTDVMMPGMDGIELLKRLKVKEPTIVVIVMTGFAEKDIILSALKEDADDFIAKPLNLLQLKTAVDKALVKKSLKEEIAALKSMDRLKSNFLSTISHKFRTPLTSISLFLQNLSTGILPMDDPEFGTYVRLVSDESSYLERLVSDLLVFSRMMDTGELRREPVNLTTAIHNILAESRELATKPSLEVDLDLCEIPAVKLDKEKVAFTLRQIIDNACKFTKAEGKVKISLHPIRDGIILEVRDNGIGIPADELPKVCEKFYQIDKQNTGQVRGFGLGLFYAKEFVRMHGGTLNIDSINGEGTVVTVWLPLEPA